MFTDSENTKKLIKPDNEQKNEKIKKEMIAYMKKFFGNSFYGDSFIISDFMKDFIVDTDIYGEDE